MLERRGFRVAHAQCSHEAVGEVCAFAHEELEGREVRSRTVVLILTEPASLEHLAKAYHAITTYCPRAACWWFDGASRRLRATDISAIARWSAGLEVVVKAKSAPGSGGATVRVPQHSMQAVMQPVPQPPRSVPAASRIGPPGGPLASPGEAEEVVDAFLGKGGGRPTLRLAGEGTLPPSTEESENPLPGDSNGPSNSQGSGFGGMLTGEELAMLLDPDPPGRAFRKE